MGSYSGRLIDTAPDYLVQHNHVTCQEKHSVATLLLLNMTVAYNQAVPAQLLHKVRERKIISGLWSGWTVSSATELQLSSARIKYWPLSNVHMNTPRLITVISSFPLEHSQPRLCLHYPGPPSYLDWYYWEQECHSLWQKLRHQHQTILGAAELTSKAVRISWGCAAAQPS
jgi:hypothetical protein